MHLGLLYYGHPYTHTQLKKCNIGFYALTHTHTSRHFAEGVGEVSAIRSEASACQALRGDDVIDILPNKWNGVTRRLKNTRLLFHRQTRQRMWRTIERRGRWWQWFPIRAGGLWLRAAARLTPARCWPPEWQGCHGDQGASAWGRRPAAEGLPMWRFLCIWVNGKSLPVCCGEQH